MSLIPRVKGGNYGNGTFGIKASTPGYDVTILADDNDPIKRSFNSQWPSLAKLKVVGVGLAVWTQKQYQTINQYSIGSTVYAERWSVSSWVMETPIQIPTGMSAIPIWEERLFDIDSSTFYDDHVFVAGSPPNQSSSGGRSYHSGPTDIPANTIFLTPYIANEKYAEVANINKSAPYPAFGGSAPPYPSYPAYPAKPSTKIACAYSIYSNALGVVS